jgi:predicted secreted Zn-dependent protease
MKMNLIRAAAKKRIALAVLASVAAVPAASSAQTPPAAVPVAPTVSPLAQIPGVAVRYYNVTGTTIPAMRASIEAQRPKNPVTGMASPSSAEWSVSTSVRKRTTGKRCKITGATATFKGEVVLPRLVTQQAAPVPAPVMAEWQRYVSSLEMQQAALLRQVPARLPEVERAVMASSCKDADAAANRAVAAIRQSLARPATAPTAAPAPTTN